NPESHSRVYSFIRFVEFVHSERNSERIRPMRNQMNAIGPQAANKDRTSLSRLRSVVATLEDLGNDVYHEYRQTPEAPTTVEAVHHEAVLRLFHRLANAGFAASVYEGLLGYRPVLDETSTPQRPYHLCRDRARRKRSGSFYTPAAVVEFLVEQTLGPLLHR